MDKNFKHQKTKIPKYLNQKKVKKTNTINELRNLLLICNFPDLVKRSGTGSLFTYKRGIALLVAIGTMIIIFILGALAVYLTTRGLGITIGQTRYETAYEAAVASLEVGKARAEYMNQTINISDTTETIQVGQYTTTLNVERTSHTATILSGSALKFARAVSDPGQTPSTGSYRTYYIKTQSVGKAGERVIVEMLQRYTILAE
jgi:hypothetical protein